VATRAETFATMATVGFSRANKNVAAVASPYTGIFYDAGDGFWRSLSAAIPPPLPQVSALAFQGGSLYFATEGRGMERIDYPDSAPLATYFEQPTNPPPGVLRVLARSDHTVLAARAVRVTLRRDGQVALDTTVSTDGLGRVAIPASTSVEGATVHLHFAGDTASAPSDTRYFVCSSSTGFVCGNRCTPLRDNEAVCGGNFRGCPIGDVCAVSSCVPRAAPTTLISGTYYGFGFTVDSVNAYLSHTDFGGQQPRITIQPLDGSPSTDIMSPGPYPGPLTVDANNIYWGDESNEIVQHPIVGGTSQILASGYQAVAIAVSATDV
jgi:hypothetical protein